MNTKTNKPQQQNSDQQNYTFFLFINPTSGGNAANEYLLLKKDSLTFQIQLNDENQNQITKTDQKTYNIGIQFCNLQNEESKQKNCQQLKQMQLKNLKNSNLRVIVCGGDGTVMWVISELSKHDCNMEQLILGIIPFGTGNDFSRVLGWGGEQPAEITGEDLIGLKNLARQWVQASISDFDIWEVKAETYEEGYFNQIKKLANNQIGRQQLKTPDNKVKTVFEKQMCNYMSIGVDSRIGFGFDKNRTQSAFCNKCVYCWEGFKKLFLKTLKIKNVIANIQQAMGKKQQSSPPQKNLNITLQQQKQQNQMQEIIINDIEKKKSDDQLQSENEILFVTELSKQQILSEKNKQKVLKHDPVSLIILNINSYSGGCYDMWEHCSNSIGLHNNDGEILNEQDLNFQKQSFGDGKLEFLAYYSIFGLANERFFAGQGSKVAQGSGPFTINFNRVDAQTKNKIITYFQVDGEYLQIYYPKTLTISKSSLAPNGKIKVQISKNHTLNQALKQLKQ